MTNIDLAMSYMIKARNRLELLDVLLAKRAFSDVIREAQEIVELATKAMLRRVGIDPPKWHDVGEILLDNACRFLPEVKSRLSQVAEISKSLRVDRELSFYGDIDFIPTEEYTRQDAEKAIADTSFVMEVANTVFTDSPG
jgi:HEPN domain-containing protein